MAYCKFQADQLFTGVSLLTGDHVLITNENGSVLEIVPTKEAGEDIQLLEGIITPGLFNCHCHLELSHMRDSIPAGGGLTGFIAAVMKMPAVDMTKREEAMRLAAREMYDGGIVGVGDICNLPVSAPIKAASPIHWYNFLEVINLDEEKAKEKIAAYLKIGEAFGNATAQKPISLSPHAIYSVSPSTFRLINAYTAGKTITIHNQESTAEDELLVNGTGAFLSFYASIGRTGIPVSVSGKSSLQTWLPYFNKGQTILLVHNTYINEEDIVFANAYAQQHSLNLYYCICANANLYIENTSPPLDLLRKHNCNIVLGTDSYGSNWQLSIAHEIAAIHKRFPAIPLLEMLQWATCNGAKALQWQAQMGSFEKGKKPGIVLIENDLNTSRRLL